MTAEDERIALEKGVCAQRVRVSACAACAALVCARSFLARSPGGGARDEERGTHTRRARTALHRATHARTAAQATRRRRSVTELLTTEEVSWARRARGRARSRSRSRMRGGRWRAGQAYVASLDSLLRLYILPLKKMTKLKMQIPGSVRRARADTCHVVMARRPGGDQDVEEGHHQRRRV